ncbi:MAG: hypothetical protein ABUK01_18045 [Leptospirales bacterium]
MITTLNDSVDETINETLFEIPQQMQEKMQIAMQHKLHHERQPEMHREVYYGDHEGLEDEADEKYIQTCLYEKTEKNIEIYEHHLFSAFAQSGQKDVFNLWGIVGNNRLRHNISYDDLSIYAVFTDQGLVCALTAHTGNGPKQYEELGFYLPPDNDSCEFISLFCRESHIPSLINEVFAFAIADLKQRNFKTTYGTAEDARTKLYCRCGFTKIARKQTPHMNKSLLKFDLENPPSRWVS